MKLSVVSAMLLMFAGLVFSQIPSQGLVSWICFTGNNLDSCGGVTFLPHNFGTPPTLVEDRYSSANSATHLPGSNTFLALNTTAIPSGASSRTISMWVSRDIGATGSLTFISYGKNQPGKYLTFGVTPSSNLGTYVYVKNGTDSLTANSAFSEMNSRACFPVDVWKHIALVINGDTTIFYQNGKEWARKVIRSWATVTDSFFIGGLNYQYGAKNGFGGKIDDIAIYNKALSSTAIKSLYEAGSYRSTPPTFRTRPDTILNLGIQYRYTPLTNKDISAQNCYSVMSLTQKPAGMVIQDKNILSMAQLVYWTPTMAGTYSMKITAMDTCDDTVSQTATLIVLPPTNISIAVAHSVIKGEIIKVGYNAQGRKSMRTFKSGVVFNNYSKRVYFNK